MSPFHTSSDLEVSSPLLRLPGEIRNKIYQYVLTSSAPLHRRQTWNLVSSHNLKLFRHHSFEEETAPSDTRPHPFFNSLKFVSRQVYAEIAGLELKLNTLFFESQAELQYLQAPDTVQKTTAQDWFFDFVESLTEEKLQWLSTVIIASNQKFNDVVPLPAVLTPLVVFAKDHPNIDVRYQFTDFCLDFKDIERPIREFFRFGFILTCALRDAEESRVLWEAMIGLAHFPHMIVAAVAGFRKLWSRPAGFGNVSNFSIWPTSGFDEVKAALEAEKQGMHIEEMDIMRLSGMRKCGRSMALPDWR